MKKSRKIYFRSLYISLVVIMCISFGCLGVARAYENTLLIGFGEQKKAIEMKDGVLRILDFEISFYKT